MMRRKKYDWGHNTVVRNAVTLAFAAGLSASVLVSAQENIHVKKATYGDHAANKTCDVDVSICEGTSECAFEVGDELCGFDPASGVAKNLIVIYSCGKDLREKGEAAANGTRIRLSCRK